MIELVFIACLKADLDACEQKILSYVRDGAGATSCGARAQPELAAWAASHPAFVITSWRCEDASQRQTDL